LRRQCKSQWSTSGSHVDEQATELENSKRSKVLDLALIRFSTLLLDVFLATCRIQVLLHIRQGQYIPDQFTLIRVQSNCVKARSRREVFVRGEFRLIPAERTVRHRALGLGAGVNMPNSNRKKAIVRTYAASESGPKRRFQNVINKPLRR
jgi:hypothetical protein